MKIQDFFAEAFYINLDKRTDRRAEFEAEIARVGLADFVQRYPAAVDATHLPMGDYGRHRACGKSHSNLIKYAAEKNLDNILIFEDDAYFYDKNHLSGVEIVERALDDLAHIPDWDVFYFGGLIGRETAKPVTPNLITVNYVLSNHAYGVSRKAINTLLRYDPDVDSAIDGWIGGRDMKLYVAYPLASPQREGRSDIDAWGNSVGVTMYEQYYDDVKKRFKL